MSKKMFAALVLAAGGSTRMGRNRNKLLEEFDGTPLVRLPVEAIRNAGIEKIVVVTGYEAEAVAAQLGGLECQCVENPDWEQGMGSSIASGAVAAEKLGPDAVLVCVADLPALRASHISRILAAFRSRDDIIVPRHEGRRGHPVLFGAKYLRELALLRGDVGGREILNDHASSIIEIEFESDAITRDVDSPEDLAAWRR